MRIFKSLYARVALALAVLLVVIGTVIGVAALQATGMFIQESEQRFNRDLARQLLVQGGFVRNELLDEKSIHRLFNRYMHINPSIEIYLLDLDGRIVAYEAPQMRIKRHRVNVTPIRRFLEKRSTYPILGDDPRDRHRQKVFSAATVPLDHTPRQYLYVVLGGEAFDSTRTLIQKSYLARFSLIAVAGVVLFGILAGTLAFHLLTRPLRRLTAVMDDFRQSGFRNHHRFSGSGSGDEIDRLGETFNRMATRINDQVTELEDNDSLRRNLVANVSHDLRTPLAALQGYLETLILKGELPAAERRRYLRTAFRQSERLTRLVGELFELAKLDAREARPELEPVAVGELLHDIAQQFQPRIEESPLRLELRIPPGLPLVSADIAMLNRVIDNLTDNALLHTPDGGVIRLEASQTVRGIRISVSNTGKPIAPAEMHHLFERFYQTPEKHTGKGAGLGLAIVKRILDLHDVEVDVQSTLKETTFAFVLKPWRDSGETAGEIDHGE